MTNDWCSIITSACPLPIGRVLWDEHALVLGGPGWSFACTAPWRVVAGETMIAGCEDRIAAGTVAELEGLRVVRCESLVRLASGDLRLVLSDGRALEVFVANHVDPWVFSLPGGPIFVPSPGDPGWFGAGGR
jgi:hypothetical protein